MSFKSGDRVKINPLYKKTVYGCYPRLEKFLFVTLTSGALKGESGNGYSGTHYNFRGKDSIPGALYEEEIEEYKPKIYTYREILENK